MLDLGAAHESRDASEAIDREASIIVVNLQNGSHCSNGLLILVEPSKVVERIWAY
jgi:hypothetical protein